MFVLLIDTDSPFQKGMYLYTEKFTESMERLLIELYYRDVAEGLVESASTLKKEDYSVYNIREWLDVKLKETTELKSTEALEKLAKLV